MSLPLAQKSKETFGVNTNTSFPFDQYGSVCGCPQFWGLSTDGQNAGPSLPAQLSNHDTSLGCPYSLTSSFNPNMPSAGVAADATTGAASTHPMSTAEPRAPPSRVLKETCIFWYHGNCGRGADCRYEHELNHNWPISRPPGYAHHRRCDLKFCPLRTDLVEMMQRYYPAAREGYAAEEIEEELDVGPKDKEHTATLLGDDAADSNSTETSEDESSTDSDSDSDSSDMEDEESSNESVADDASASSSDAGEVKSSPVLATPLASLQFSEHKEPHMTHAGDPHAETSLHEHYEPVRASVSAQEAIPDAQSNADTSKRRRRTHRGGRRGKKIRARHDEVLVPPLATDTRTMASSAPTMPQPANIDIVATSRTSLPPSPPGLPRVILPPTSISHAGTQRRKRKASSQGVSSSTKKPDKRQRLQMAAERAPALKKHDLPPNPETAPLMPRATYRQPTGPKQSPQGLATVPFHLAHHAPQQAPQAPPASRTTSQPTKPKIDPRRPAPLPHHVAHRTPPQVPQAPPERPGICFIWYHQGYCRPKRSRNGRTQACKYLHRLVPREKVSRPAAIDLQKVKHAPDCALPLCPVASAREGKEAEEFMDYGSTGRA